MSEIKLNVAVSLDGYLARINGDVDFLDQGNSGSGMEESFKKFLSSIDTIVMGSSSYDKTLELSDYPFKDKLTYVLTSQEYADEANVVFTKKEISELADEMISKSEKDIWLFGGAKVIKQFIDLDLVDEFIITTIPVIIGTGIPLFLFSNDDKKLKLIKTDVNDGLVTLHYIRKRK